MNREYMALPSKMNNTRNFALWILEQEDIPDDATVNFRNHGVYIKWKTQEEIDAELSLIREMQVEASKRKHKKLLKEIKELEDYLDENTTKSEGWRT